MRHEFLLCGKSEEIGRGDLIEIPCRSVLGADRGEKVSVPRIRFLDAVIIIISAEKIISSETIISPTFINDAYESIGSRVAAFPICTVPMGAEESTYIWVRYFFEWLCRRQFTL
jgi:hypothetical protein